MKKIFPVVLLFVRLVSFADENPGAIAEALRDGGDEEDYYDFGMAEGITVYGEFPSDSVEAGILARINGFSKDRQQFIQEELLRDAGFQRSASAKFRQTTGEEKTSSVMHTVFRIISLGLIPVPEKPLLEVEYARLPRGEYYKFESVIYASKFKNVSGEVRTVMELEYMLQVEFCNGVLLRDWNLGYYTPKNIAKFEDLANSLPESPPSIKQLKDRYLNKDLPRIKAALARFNNPNEQYRQAMQNLDIDAVP